MAAAGAHGRRCAAVRGRRRHASASRGDAAVLGPGLHAATPGERERERERGRGGEGEGERESGGGDVPRETHRGWEGAGSKGEAGVDILVSEFEAEAEEATNADEKPLRTKAAP